MVRVERAYDPGARQFIAPKSAAGRRTVPLPNAAKDALDRLTPGEPDALVFTRDDGRPIDAGALGKRAAAAWHDAGLEPIRLHDARHVFASFAIAAGVNLKQLAAYLGHASISITLDRYGHLLPGSERDAAELLDRFLDGASLGQSDPASAGVEQGWGTNGEGRQRPKSPAERANSGA